MRTKRCVVCGKKFKTKVPLQKTCSPHCARKWRLEYRRNYYSTHAEAHRETMKKYYEKHRNKYIKINRKWRENNKEYFNNYIKNVYPRKHVQKMCDSYSFHTDTADAMIKGGKRLDERLKELMDSNALITVKFRGARK